LHLPRLRQIISQSLNGRPDYRSAEFQKEVLGKAEVVATYVGNNAVPPFLFLFFSLN